MPKRDRACQKFRARCLTWKTRTRDGVKEKHTDKASELNGEEGWPSLCGHEAQWSGDIRLRTLLIGRRVHAGVASGFPQPPAAAGWGEGEASIRGGSLGYCTAIGNVAEASDDNEHLLLMMVLRLKVGCGNIAEVTCKRGSVMGKLGVFVPQVSDDEA